MRLSSLTLSLIFAQSFIYFSYAVTQDKGNYQKSYVTKKPNTVLFCDGAIPFGDLSVTNIF
ncbi:MAG: hypothetical protein HGGPFJEG_01183 [Ignavibacteria bacterium]|nr:hypothetical protein [Ignavibacteria bacterium]